MRLLGLRVNMVTLPLRGGLLNRPERDGSDPMVALTAPTSRTKRPLSGPPVRSIVPREPMTEAESPETNTVVTPPESSLSKSGLRRLTESARAGAA